MKLLVNLDKSKLKPSQEFDFKGALLDIKRALVTPKLESRLKTLEMLEPFPVLPSPAART
jgi:hypothetical protein